MNILQVNCVYGTGSTGNITRDLHRTFLALGHRSTVLYGRGPRAEEPSTCQVCSDRYGRAQGLAARIAGLPYGHCAWATRRLIGQIHRIRPDVVHLQCLNGHFCNLYHLLAFLKEAQIPTVLTLHAEFPYTGGCSHAGTCSGFLQRCTGCTVPVRRPPAFWETGQKQAGSSFAPFTRGGTGWLLWAAPAGSPGGRRRPLLWRESPFLSFPTASTPAYSSPVLRTPPNCGSPCPSHPASGSFSLPPRPLPMARGLTCFGPGSLLRTSAPPVSCRRRPHTPFPTQPHNTGPHLRPGANGRSLLRRRRSGFVQPAG